VAVGRLLATLSGTTHDRIGRSLHDDRRAPYLVVIAPTSTSGTVSGRSRRLLSAGLDSQRPSGGRASRPTMVVITISGRKSAFWAGIAGVRAGFVLVAELLIACSVTMFCSSQLIVDRSRRVFLCLFPCCFRVESTKRTQPDKHCV